MEKNEFQNRVFLFSNSLGAAILNNCDVSWLLYCSDTKSFCDGLRGSMACASNSQMASSLSQIRVTCSSMKMSSFPLEIEKNIQAMKSYRFFQ